MTDNTNQNNMPQIANNNQAIDQEIDQMVVPTEVADLLAEMTAMETADAQAVDTSLQAMKDVDAVMNADK